MSLIEATGLTKVYKRFEKAPGLAGSVRSLFHRQTIEKRAVDGFDLRVEAGEFIGLIGANGAGKTTLIKMLTGIIAPSAGSLSVLGFEPNRLENDFKRRYAVVMGQKSQLFFELTPADTFLLFKELYAIPDAKYRRDLDYFIALFDIEQLMNVQVRTLSLGERMKMELVAALLHNPEVLFLDEPTIGLDTVAQRQMRGFLREVNRDRGTTILLTSHYMEDILSLCPRCVVVSDGRKLYDGALSTLIQTYQHHKRINVSFQDVTDVQLPGDVQVVARDAYKMSLLAQRDQVQAVLAALIAQGTIADISVEEEDIGVIVERIYAAGKEAAV